MCQKSLLAIDRVFWTTEDDAILIQCLFEWKGEITSNQMFKEPAFTAAAVKLCERKAGSKFKSDKFEDYLRNCYCLKSISGMVWDNEKGMGVMLDRQSEWDELTKNKKHFKQFANKGWPHYEAMEPLMLLKAKGTYAHRAHNHQHLILSHHCLLQFI
ncbi:hypothetical protein BJV74DRAFT_904641 [Russula compacta]|nr:hypothetical protein BJV74DRAFT_904641 [Russula compacta]